MKINLLKSLIDYADGSRKLALDCGQDLSPDYESGDALYGKLKHSVEVKAGQYGSIELVTSTREVELSGSSVSLTGWIPAGSQMLGVVGRVLQAVTGPASWNIGIGSDPDKFGAQIPLAAGSTSDFARYNTNPLEFFYNAGTIIVSNDGVTPFSGGKVRVTAFYLRVNAPSA